MFKLITIFLLTGFVIYNTVRLFTKIIFKNIVNNTFNSSKKRARKVPGSNLYMDDEPENNQEKTAAQPKKDYIDIDFEEIK